MLNDNIDTSELLNMMDSVDFSDPDQAATALQVLSMVVGDEETTLTSFRDIYPTTTSSTIKEAPEVDENGEEKTTLKQTTSTIEVPIKDGLYQVLFNNTILYTILGKNIQNYTILYTNTIPNQNN